MPTLIQQPNRLYPFALSECIYAKLRFTDVEALSQPRRKAQIQFQFGVSNTVASGTVIYIAGINFTTATTGTSNINTIAYPNGSTAAVVANAITVALNANPYFQGRITTTLVGVVYTIVFDDYEVLSNFITNSLPAWNQIYPNTFNAIDYNLKEGLRVIWNLYETGTNLKLNRESIVSVIYRNTQTGFFESDIYIADFLELELSSLIKNECLSPYFAPIQDTKHNRTFYLKYQIIEQSLIDCNATTVAIGQTVDFNVVNSYIDSLGQFDMRAYVFYSIFQIQTQVVKPLTLMPTYNNGGIDVVDFCFCMGSCVNMSMILNLKRLWIATSPTVVPYYYYLRQEFNGAGVLQNTTYLLITSGQDGTFIIPASPPAAFYGAGSYYEIQVYGDILNTTTSKWIMNRMRFYYDNCNCKEEIYFLNRLGSMETAQFNKVVDISINSEFTETKTNSFCTDAIETKLFDTGQIGHKDRARKFYRFSVNLKKTQTDFYEQILSSPLVLMKDKDGNKKRLTVINQKTQIVSATDYGNGREMIPFSIEGYVNLNEIIGNY